VVAAVADGVIVGSALVRHLSAAAAAPKAEMLAGIESTVKRLVAAVDGG
jgi:tryptophan synthase alpha subunit